MCCLQGNYRNGFVYTIVLLITFWILFSYLVPISLFVTLEIVKFWQAFLYINNDREMKVIGSLLQACGTTHGSRNGSALLLVHACFSSGLESAGDVAMAAACFQLGCLDLHCLARQLPELACCSWGRLCLLVQQGGGGMLGQAGSQEMSRL